MWRWMLQQTPCLRISVWLFWVVQLAVLGKMGPRSQLPWLTLQGWSLRALRWKATFAEVETPTLWGLCVNLNGHRHNP